MSCSEHVESWLRNPYFGGFSGLSCLTLRLDSSPHFHVHSAFSCPHLHLPFDWSRWTSCSSSCILISLFLPTFFRSIALSCFLMQASWDCPLPFVRSGHVFSLSCKPELQIKRGRMLVKFGQVACMEPCALSEVCSLMFVLRYPLRVLALLRPNA
jgi:hypothetical protein